MRYYIELMKRYFQQVFVYRIDALFGLFGGLMGIFIQVSIWKALYAGKGMVEGFDLAEMITYVLIVQIVRTAAEADFNRRIGGIIRTGEISMHLIRPVPFRSALFAERAGQTLAEFIIQLLPKLVIAALVFGIKPPASVLHGLAFVLLAVGAAILSYNIQFLEGLLCFWVISPVYANSLNNVFFGVLSGNRIPLPFFPRFVTAIAAYLPFRFVFYVPVSVYLGKIAATDLPQYILIQWVWIAAMMVLGRVTWSRAIRKLVVQGG